MIDILSREPIGKIYEVDTELTTDFVHNVDFHDGREQLLSTMDLIPGVVKFNIDIRKSNNVEYIVAIFMIKKENDTHALWKEIEEAFDNLGIEA